MSVAAAVLKLLELGATPEMLAVAVEGMVEAAKAVPRSKGAQRQAAYRERHKASQVTEVTDSDAPAGFPNDVSPNLTTPVLTLNPSLKENPPKGGQKKCEIAIPPKSPLPRRSRQRGPAPGEYPGDFEMVWQCYPRREGTSKSEAFRAWERLSEAERENLLNGVIAFETKVKTEGIEARFIPHFVVFINQRRWETLLEAAE